MLQTRARQKKFYRTRIVTYYLDLICCFCGASEAHSETFVCVQILGYLHIFVDTVCCFMTFIRTNNNVYYTHGSVVVQLEKLYPDEQIPVTGSRHESKLYLSIDKNITCSSDIRTTSHSLVKKIHLLFNFFFSKTFFLKFLFGFLQPDLVEALGLRVLNWSVVAWSGPRKKSSLGRSLAESHAYNPIRYSRTRLASAKSLAKSLAETLSKTLGENLGETLGKTFRVRQSSPQSLGSDSF